MCVYFYIFVILNSFCFKTVYFLTFLYYCTFTILHQLLKYNCRLTESLYIRSSIFLSYASFPHNDAITHATLFFDQYPFSSLYHRGPIVLVFIKQFLALMNRDGHVYTGTHLTFTHTHARWIRNCTANLHLTAIKNRLRTRQGNGEARGRPEK